MTDDNIKDLEYINDVIVKMIETNTDLMSTVFMSDDKATQAWKKMLLESNAKLTDVIAILEDLIDGV